MNRYFINCILLLAFLCNASLSVFSQNCTGNACSAISFINNPNGRQSVRNGGGQAVSVGIKWYFSQCQNMAYWTINPGQTMDFPYNSHCLPYSANYVTNPVPPAQNGRIVFRNNRGGIVYVYAVVSNNGAVINVCSQRILQSQLANGQSSTVIVFPAGKVFNYYVYTNNTTCDAGSQVMTGVIASGQAQGQTIQIN